MNVSAALREVKKASPRGAAPRNFSRKPPGKPSVFQYLAAANHMLLAFLRDLPLGEVVVHSRLLSSNSFI